MLINGNPIYPTLISSNLDIDNPILALGQMGYDNSKYVIKIGDGKNVWKYLPYINLNRTLNSYTWEEISDISQKGLAQEYFKIGEEKVFYLPSGEKVTVAILGFNHDDLTTGDKAGITFGMTNMFKGMEKMDKESSNINGWTSSSMRTSYMKATLSQFPSDLQSVIKQVNKKTSEGNLSANISTSTDKLFLLSEVEIMGTTTYSMEGEGNHYSYYKDIINTPSQRIKVNENPLIMMPLLWWLRSPCKNDVRAYCGIDHTGNPMTKKVYGKSTTV